MIAIFKNHIRNNPVSYRGPTKHKSKMEYYCLHMSVKEEKTFLQQKLIFTRLPYEVSVFS
jgi:hypothetical protein